MSDVAGGKVGAGGKNPLCFEGKFKVQRSSLLSFFNILLCILPFFCSPDLFYSMLTTDYNALAVQASRARPFEHARAHPSKMTVTHQTTFLLTTYYCDLNPFFGFFGTG